MPSARRSNARSQYHSPPGSAKTQAKDDEDSVNPWDIATLPRHAILPDTGSDFFGKLSDVLS